MTGPKLIMVKRQTFVFSDKACPIFCCSLQLDIRRDFFAAHLKVASCILEMWYNYHSSLWTYCSGSPKVSLENPHILKLYILRQP